MNEYELLGSPGGNSSKDHVWRVATVGLIILVNQFSMFVIFPFLPFMVMYFFPDLPKEKVGFYAGYLGSSFFVGNVAASIFWGRLSDRAGRRPALLYATAGIIVTILIFGLSKTFAMAIIARFLWGAVNGNSGVAKTYLSEICNEENQAQGYAIIGFAGSTGRLLGPMIGGFLSQPAQKYPSAFRNLKFFEEFPFILPMIFAAVLSAIILLISYFKIKETLKPPFENFTNSQDDSIQYSPEQNSWRRALFDYRVIISVSLFSLLSFSSTFMEEAIPLWLVLDVDSGGFSMESKDIGTLISIASPFQLMFQAFVFPKLAKLYGFRAVFSGSMAVMGTSSFILPFTSVFVPKSRSPSFKHWIPLLIVYIIYLIGRFFGFASVYALINHSTRRKYRGEVNGVGQTLSSAFRAVAPISSGSLFAYCVSVNSGLLNFRFVFFVISVVIYGACALSYFLPESIDQRMSLGELRIPVLECDLSSKTLLPKSETRDTEFPNSS